MFVKLEHFPLSLTFYSGRDETQGLVNTSTWSLTELDPQCFVICEQYAIFDSISQHLN